jgi:hypothetical protein
VHNCCLFENAGEPNGFVEQVVIDVEGGPHMYAYALYIYAYRLGQTATSFCDQRPYCRRLRLTQPNQATI